MKKILTIFLISILFTPIEYFATELLKHLFIPGYYSALNFGDVWGICIIFSIISVGLILLFSYLIRNRTVNNSHKKIGVKIGATLFIVWFLFSSFVSFGTYNLLLITGLAFTHFIMGFIFPWLYRSINKKPLFNESFY